MRTSCLAVSTVGFAAQSANGGHSRVGALIVIHKSHRARNAEHGLLQPGGLSAISRRLSEATPPANVKKAPRPRRGRSNQAMNLGTLPKTLQMLDSDWQYLKTTKDRLRPLRGR